MCRQQQGNNFASTRWTFVINMSFFIGIASSFPHCCKGASVKSFQLGFSTDILISHELLFFPICKVLTIKNDF